MSAIDKNNNSEEKINTSNIFDEFEIDDKTREEIENIKIKKDSYYYMNKIGFILRNINFILIFIIIFSFLYVYIEKSDSNLVTKKDYLEPFCDILNGDGIKVGNICSGLHVSNILLEKNIESNEKIYLKKIIPILKKGFEIESVKNSKETLFLLDKKENKSDPINILNEFDKLKNKFIPIKKSKIICNNVTIAGNRLYIKCSSFSRAWSSKIPSDGLGNKTEGTSITLASSFIDFLSKSGKFDIIKKQKTFEKKPYFGEGEYTYKTDFDIVLEYNKKTLLLK